MALRDDLDQSGMIDVVVAREDGPSVVLTLDKRFATDQALELMHTSSFTVVGKVTQVWPADTDVVNLYRRSVLSLLPALGQTVTWGMLTLLATVAGSLDPAAAERAAYAAAGLKQAGSSAYASNEKGDAAEDADEPDTQGSEQRESQTAAAQVEEEQPEIMLGEAVEALAPAVSGPAFQLLPLAICA